MLYTDKETEIELVDLKKAIKGFSWEDSSAAFLYAKNHRYDILNFKTLEKNIYSRDKSRRREKQGIFKFLSFF